MRREGGRNTGRRFEGTRLDFRETVIYTIKNLHPYSRKYLRSVLQASNSKAETHDVKIIIAASYSIAALLRILQSFRPNVRDKTLY
jgi:hypothetical protein